MLSKFLAYEPERHALESVMRLQAVKRWHMIDTTRVQTLAEHSANVAMLVLLISKTAPINYFSDGIVVAALVHDLPEAFTGDIPSHTKKYLSGVDELEDITFNVVFKVDVSANDKLLIKLCDLADGIRFIRLHGVDMTADHARDGLEDQMQLKFDADVVKLEWPDHVISHVKDHLMFYAYECV